MPITRRAIMTGAAAATGWPLAIAAARAAATLEGNVKGPPVKDVPLKQVSPHVFMVQAPDGFPTPENQGLMSNVIFVIGQKGVVVFDSGASLQIAEMTIRQLKAHTDKPVVGVVNSHYHGDHWLGNHGFVDAWGEGLPIYAHAGTRTAVAGATGKSWHDSMISWTHDATLGTRIVPPNRDVGHGFEISLGDATLRVHKYGVAHTPNDISIEVPEDNVMCVGDILMDRRIANMDDGSYKGTFETIDALTKNSKTKLWVPGHGAAGPHVVNWQRSLFEGIYESCVTAVKQNIPLKGALAVAMKDPRVASKAKETAGFEKNIGKYVSLAYLEAEQDNF